MRIEEKEETKVIKTKVYISADGRTFDNEEDCKKWEKSYQGTIELSMQTIKKEQVNAIDLYIPWANEDSEVWVTKPKDINEVTLLNAYISIYSDETRAKVTSEMINKVIAMDFGYDRDFCEVYILEDHIKNVKKSVETVLEKFND